MYDRAEQRTADRAGLACCRRYPASGGRSGCAALAATRAPGHEPHDDDDGHGDQPDDEKRLERCNDPAHSRDGKRYGEDRADDCPDDRRMSPVCAPGPWQATVAPAARSGAGALRAAWRAADVGITALLTTLGDGVTREAGDSGWSGLMACPPRSGGNDHGSFHSQFRVRVFEKPSGRPDLNRRPLDPHHVPGVAGRGSVSLSGHLTRLDSRLASLDVA